MPPFQFTLVAIGLLTSVAACGKSQADSAASDTTQSNSPMVQEGFVTASDSARLFYRLVGSGPDTIIVLHGGPGFTHDYIGPDLEPLTRRHALLLYDQRGAGKSTLVRDSTALTGARHAEDIEDIRKQFGMAKVTLLGHSWGTGLAALYGERYPGHIGRMILVASMPATRKGLIDAFTVMAGARDTGETRRMDEAMAARVANPGDYAACRAYYVLWFRPFFVDSAAGGKSRGDFCDGTPESRTNKMQSVDKYTFASLGDFDLRPALRKVSAPTLVIHGDKDVLPLADAREYARVMRDARVLTVAGTGHFLYLEQPDQFFAAVNEFMQGRWPAGAEPVR